MPYYVEFWIDNQGFKLMPTETRKEAKWYMAMLEKALDKLIYGTLPETITPRGGLKMWFKRKFCKHTNLRSLGSHYIIGAKRTCQQCADCDGFKTHF